MTQEMTFDPGAFATRLKDLILPEKYAAFCERAGISLSVLNKYLAAPEGLSPSVEMVVRICRATQSSLDWLLCGIGDGPETASDIVYIPMIDIQFAAGAGWHDVGAIEGRQMMFDRELLQSLGRNSAAGLKVVRVRGDSMEPTIADGSFVIVDLLDKDLREDIFAFRAGDDLRIKRLRPVGLADVEAISDNRFYPPERYVDAMRDGFEVIGRVIWSFGDV